MSNVERQRRWMDRNRALHNFRRRKKNLGGATSENRRPSGSGIGCKADTMEGELATGQTRPATNLLDGSRPPKSSTIEALRELISRQHEYAEGASVKPRIFRDDYGRVISEGQWEKLQEAKHRANEGGFSIDEWSQ